MTVIELSPLGAARERPVSCVQCRKPTWNHSAACDSCKATAKKRHPSLRRCCICGGPSRSPWCSDRCHAIDDGPDPLDAA